MVSAFEGADDVYNELVAVIKSRELDSAALEQRLFERITALDEVEGQAIAAFEIAQSQFLGE